MPDMIFLIARRSGIGGTGGTRSLLQLLNRFQHGLAVAGGRHPAREPGADAAHAVGQSVALAEFGADVLRQKIEVPEVIGPEGFAGKIGLQPYRQVKKGVDGRAENQHLTALLFGVDAFGDIFQGFIVATAGTNQFYFTQFIGRRVEIIGPHEGFPFAMRADYQCLVDKGIELRMVGMFGSVVRHYSTINL